MHVNPGYIAEQAIVAVGALATLTAVMLQFSLAWRLPENQPKVQIFHKIVLASLLVFEFLSWYGQLILAEFGRCIPRSVSQF
jgi:hypothetical protein